MLLVRNLVHSFVQFYPPDLRRQIKRELPALRTQAARLALEVLDAEGRGVRFSAAVLRPDFPLMGRVHFGIVDALRHRIPAKLRQSLQDVISEAGRGTFDNHHQLMFAIASRPDDPEAALCRFMLWQAIRMNLVISSWEAPIVEVSGALSAAEDAVEDAIRSTLGLPDMFEEDVRPLHILVAEALVRASDSVNASVDTELAGELLQTVEALHAVRAMYAADAAALWPGAANGPLGSQQIADRYPQHFRTANDVDQRRSRARRRLPVPAAGDRLIDLLRDLSVLETAQ